MENIHIYDNFLNYDELSYVLEYINANNYWKFGHSSGTSEPIDTKFFSITDMSEYFFEFLKHKIENIVFARTPELQSSVDVQGITVDGLPSNVIDKLEKTPTKQQGEEHVDCRKQLKLIRNYMHIQTFGQDGAYHIDCSADNDKAYTFCIYFTELNDQDVENSKGEFFIKIPNTSYVVSIDTYSNRGIFFPSIYEHKGMTYNRFVSTKRLCITWKLEFQ